MITDAETLSTLEFYGKSYDELRAESANSLKQLWSRLNLLSSRVEQIGDSVEQLLRYSFQYNIKIIGLPESEMQESASKTVSLCINLFKAAGNEISNQNIDIAHRIPTRTVAICYHNNLLPPLFFNLFMTNSQVLKYDTRTAGNYRVHSCRSNIKKFTILYQGPTVWNCLLASITNLSSFPMFKNKVLEFLLK